MKPISDAARSILNHGTPDLLPMRQFEGIASGVNRSNGHLQPTPLGAALLRRASACFPNGPDVVMAKISRFGSLGRRFK
jgi:hypothetical protein